MKKYLVDGGNILTGRVIINGSKNSLLAIIPACLLCRDIVELNNVTPLKDTFIMIDILKELNVIVLYDNKDKMIIDSRNVTYKVLNSEAIKKIRASYYFMGVFLSLFNKASVSLPGGCKFSSRPIDLHVLAFNKLGYDLSIKDNIYTFTKTRRKERYIEFSKVSVGASINAILATCKRNGITIIKNISIEPEVMDLIEFLNMMGANIKVNDRECVVKGVNKLKGVKHTIIDDRIEAGTYLILASLIGEDIKIFYKNKSHLNKVCNTLIDLGVDIKETSYGYLVNRVNNINSVLLECDVYPYIPTDLFPLLTLLGYKSEEGIYLKDNVYGDRFSHVSELNKLGFNIKLVDGKLAIKKSELVTNNVKALDLRCGASLVVAALLINGQTQIEDIFHIERGYYNLTNKLKLLGAHIYEKD